jgi:predicted Zn-dependent protease
MSLWDTRVAHEASYEARIEAAFDQAEAYALAGKLERALESLSEAEDLAGGLPDAYNRLRERWIASLAPLAVVVRR